jgi:LytS/YehU family sensor histidine kinase
MFDDLTPPSRGKELCPMMEKAVAELDKSDLEKMVSAMEDARWTNEALAKELTRQGFEVTETKMWKHRAKRCACARKP